MKSIEKRTVYLEKALFNAMDHDQFTLVFQPIVTMPGDALFAVETLLRWQHPEFGDISPSEFIPLAERCGAIHAIGLRVIEQALGQYALWQQHKLVPDDFMLTINVSPVQLAELGFVAKVVHLLESSNVCAKQVILEITETSPIEDYPLISGVLDQLINIGLTCAIDDFGVGYSSICHLKCLPVQAVKIDHVFVDDILSSLHSQAIVKSIMQLADQLQMITVAEGVENKEQKACLLDLGCQYMQGFYFSKPLSSKDLVAWMIDK
jgi:EAL domain-containing protein (putative c-di-GMP-specific phosphodiesterase class I)